MAASPYWIVSFGDISHASGGVYCYGSLIYVLPSYYGGYGLAYPISIGNYYVATEPTVYAHPAQVQTTQLNPHAEEWSPCVDIAPEEDRCLFLTFSKGHPLTEYEITEFFTHKYGDCLERVYVHWPKTKDNTNGNQNGKPQFGKVMFKGCLIPLTMTNCGKKQTKFMVNDKPLWCKKFEPNNTPSSSSSNKRRRRRRKCIY